MKRFQKIIIALFVFACAGIVGNSLCAQAHSIQSGKVVSERGEWLTIRLSGSTRYETSFAIADALKEETGADKFETVVIASGTGFADALAGSYLATIENAPIIMSDGTNENIKDIQEFLKKNFDKAGKIYILGGEKAVSGKVENSLKEIYSVKRLSGASRYDTNIAILEEARAVGGNADEILVCTGLDFADSLSASVTGKPILLVNTALTDSQVQFLEKNSGSKFYIIGGDKAVSDTLFKKVSAYGNTKRISGADRYKTSVEIARTFFTAPETAVVAYGNNFPDGLCGGPLAYALNAPMILADKNKYSDADTYVDAERIGNGVLLGGTGLITDEVANIIFDQMPEEKMYTLKPFTTLHTKPVSESVSIYIPYMTEIISKELTKNSEAGAWRTVEYQGKTYYLWEEKGEIYLTSQKSDYQYTTDNDMQQAVVDKALEICFEWNTQYGNGKSDGVMDSNGKYTFDCSGFVSFVLDYAMQPYVPTYDVSADITNLFNTTGIYNQGYPGEFQVKTVLEGTLDEKVLLPGDVLFFQLSNEQLQYDLAYNHCGIYLGDGKFVHCTSSWEDSVKIMPLTDIYKEGFVSAKRFLPDKVVEADAICYTNSQKTYVYPVMDSNVMPIETMKAEETVNVKFTDNGNWSYVEYQKGKYGFVLSKYLSKEVTEVSEVMYVKNASLKLYSDHTTNSTSKTVYVGTELEFKGRYSTSSYYNVVCNGKSYYMYAPDGVESKLVRDYDTLMEGFITANIVVNTNLRTTMSSKEEDNIVRMLYTGQRVRVIAQSEGQATWSYIKTEDGTYGFVLSNKLRLSQ